MLAIATAALLALSATADAATSKYRYHSYEPSYEHGHEAYAMRDYSHDSYEGHYDDQYYSHVPSYESHYRQPHHDSYDEGYGGDAYSEEPPYTYEPRQTYKQTHELRYKRSATDEMGVREDQVLVPLKKIGKVLKKVAKKVKRSTQAQDEMGVREGQFFIKKLIIPFPEETSTGKNNNKQRNNNGGNGGDDDDEDGEDDDNDEKFQPEGRHKRSVRQSREPRYKRSTSLNQEVFPGCFSSPPEDCGADCVASFRKDEGCYQCCCMDRTVNATTCALPADGGDCQGNFKRWAFNEATGDCEPFVYGGCGGNGNRFMCKEMCERHCVEEERREGQASTCPLRIRVSTGFGWNNAIGVTARLGGRDRTGALQIPGGIYRIYTKGNRQVGSGEHWVSDIPVPPAGAPSPGPTPPTHAMWKVGSMWHIGIFDNLGTSLSLARIKSSKCPHNAGFGWKYFETATDSWVEAGRGLVIRKV